MLHFPVRALSAESGECRAFPSECAAIRHGSPSSALNSTAPAPSPNRMHVLLSVQSSRLLILSAPITRIVLYIPALIYACAVLNARTNPVQAAFISKPAAFTAPTVL